MSEDLLTTEAQLMARAKELYELGDRDPQEALRRARSLAASPALARHVSKAGILIDVGAQARAKDAVREGVEILSDLHEKEPKHPGYAYNLANGLIALAHLDETPRPAWYFETRADRLRARKLFDQAAASGHYATTALTNLGNALAHSYRWVEARDAYVRTLEADPTNGVTAGCTAAELLRWADLGLGEARVLRAVASRYAARAQANRDRVLELAGPSAVERFSKLPVGVKLPRVKRPKRPKRPLRTTAYMRFVAEHRLAFALTIEGLEPQAKRWDSLRLPAIAEPIKAGPGAPVVIAMFNSLKAAYLAARRLAYESTEGRRRRDPGFYVDTLDYALYGERAATLLLAQRAALDVLDQIAVALNEYLRLGETPNGVYFSSLWREKKSTAWKPALVAEIEGGNRAIIALGELAEDLSAEGFLHRKREARNASTHRFTVVHDMKGDWRPSGAVRHVRVEDFERETLETLQHVRAALLYFVEAVALRERRHRKGGQLVVPQYLPPHHHVRGS